MPGLEHLTNQRFLQKYYVLIATDRVHSHILDSIVDMPLPGDGKEN